jgi:hypothetical protein
MRHRPTEELEQLLRERLTKVIDAEVSPPAYMDPERPLAVDIHELDVDESESN